MNRYSWVCFGESTPPHPARLRNGARSGKRGGQGAGKRRGGRGRGAPGQGELRAGREVRACITRYHSHHLIWESGITSPQLQEEKPSGIAPFSQPEPPASGPGSGHGADPDPMGTGRGCSPPGPPTTPTGTKPARGCPKRVPGSPERWVAAVAGTVAGSVRCSEPPNKSK